MQKLTLRDLCAISIFTAVTAVAAQISIPMPLGVPLTMQTFAVPLAGVVLGARKGTLSALVYVLLGAVGAPVFAGFSGGLGVILSYTGGFILSFPLMAMAAGLGADQKEKAWLWAGLVVGTAINFLCGMLYFAFLTSSSLPGAFAACVLPFLPGGAVKIVLAGIAGAKLKKALRLS